MANKLYEYTHELLVGVPKGSLIDLETTGLDARTDEIITFGYIQGQTLRIIQRKAEENDQVFVKRIRPIVEKLQSPFYVYNATLEEPFIETKFGIKGKFVDLMEPWRKKAKETPCHHCGGKGVIAGKFCDYCWGWGKLKWPQLGELISEPEEYFGEEVIHGRDVPELWNKYLKTGDFKHLQPIIQHCQMDLLRELILLIHFV